jgi:hypothetical protein
VDWKSKILRICQNSENCLVADESDKNNLLTKFEKLINIKAVEVKSIKTSSEVQSRNGLMTSSEVS